VLIVQLRNYVLLAVRVFLALYEAIWALSAQVLVLHYLIVGSNKFTSDISILAFYHKALHHHLEVSSEGLEMRFWNAAVETAIRDGAKAFEDARLAG